MCCDYILWVFFFPSENTRQRSDAFAAQNNLPKFEYVLHPRTTGFTFIVDRLRKGEHVSHHTLDESCRTHILSLWWTHQPKLRTMTCLDQTCWWWLILLFFVFFFKPQTCVSGCCQPLQHLRDSLVSVWANAGSPPGFLNTPSQYPPPPHTHRPQHCRSPPSRCCESLWCHRAPLIPFSTPLTDRLRLLFLVQAHHSTLSSIFSWSHWQVFSWKPEFEFIETRYRETLSFWRKADDSPSYFNIGCTFVIGCQKKLRTFPVFSVNTRKRSYQVCLGNLSWELVLFWLCLIVL